MPITRDITRPILSPLSRAVTEAGGGFSILSLFSSGQDGAVFEWGDLSTIYQDSTGATAGVVGQPDGLTLDKRLGLVRGGEIVTNGDFSNGTTGWAGSSATLSVASGSLRVTTTSAGSGSGQIALSTVVGQPYELFFSTANASGATHDFRVGTAPDGFQNYRNNTAGTNTSGRAVFVATATVTYISLLAFNSGGAAGNYAEWDNISVKTLSGNHASQSTTASKPTLRAGYGEFDRFDDFMTASAGGGGTTGILICAGIRAGGAASARTLWSDTGTNTGYKLTINASNQLVLSAGNGTAYTSVTGPTITVGTDYVVMGWHDGANLNVRLGLAAATSAAFGTTTAGTAGFTIGRDNGAATSLYGDRIYNLTYRKNDTSTAAQRDNIASYVANKSGITI